jgi:filamentous hemagglutinin
MIGTSSGKTIMATNKVLGRSTAGTGAIEEISIGSNLTLSGGTLSASGGVTGVAASATDILSISGSDIAADDPGADRLVFWDDSDNKLTYLTAGSGLTITGTTIAASGGIGGSTGSVDNAILRADGTGGATLQSADISIDDATTSTQNNVAITNQHAGQTNSSLVLTPKGNGAFCLAKPNGLASGGNARGQFAVDLQVGANVRVLASQVASGNYSFATGYGNTASNTSAHAMGGECTASGNTSFTLGYQCVASTNSFPIAMQEGTASSGRAALSSGVNSSANRYAMQAHAGGQFSAQGDAQRARFVLRCKTTTNAAVEMALDGGTTYLTIPSGKVMFMNIKVVGSKSDGSAVATYERQYAVKNVAGTSSQVYAPITIGTDNAAGTTIEVATVDAGDYVRIRPTGIASETWRWVASVDAVEVAYGT